jgi:hypothetical protein
MGTKEEFAQLIGAIIHNCGILELLTNDQFHALGRDETLSKEVVTLNLDRRIKLLRQLLHERSNLPTERVDSLCDQLSRIAAERNMIAHNPIASTGVRSRNPHIVVLRGMTDISKAKVLNEHDLDEILQRTREAVNTFQRELSPEKRKI